LEWDAVLKNRSVNDPYFTIKKPVVNNQSLRYFPTEKQKVNRQKSAVKTFYRVKTVSCRWSKYRSSVVKIFVTQKTVSRQQESIFAACI
jgi:hypothetical protein